MQVRCEQIAGDFIHLFPRVLGDPGVVVDRAAPPERAGAGAITFAADPAMLGKALAAGAGIIVLPLKLEAGLPAGAPGAFLPTANVKLAMALVLQRYFDAARAGRCQTPPIHPAALVMPGAVIEAGAVIAAGAFVGAGAVIGRGAFIGPGCVVEAQARVGADSILHALVFLGRDCEVGERCEIHPHTTLGADGFAYAQDERGHHHKVPQLGIVVLEDDVEIQANSAVDRAAFDVTRIGRGSKLDNFCHIAHNCQIGRHALLTGGFMVAGSTTLGDHCLAGGRTTVTDHVTVCAGVQLGGLSAVSKDITAPGAYAGHPLQPIKAYLRTTSSLAHLPEMRRRLAELENSARQIATDEALDQPDCL